MLLLHHSGGFNSLTLINFNKLSQKFLLYGANGGGIKEGSKVGNNGGSKGGNNGGSKVGNNGGSKGGIKGGSKGGIKGGSKGGNNGGSKGWIKGGIKGGSKGGNNGGSKGGSKGGNNGGKHGFLSITLEHSNKLFSNESLSNIKHKNSLNIILYKLYKLWIFYFYF